jgi:hypothetical protein
MTRGEWIRGYWAMSIALPLVLIGCTSVEPPPPQVSEPAPVVRTFDGPYRNTIRVVSRAASSQVNAWCQTPGQPVISIENGHFTYTVTHPNVPRNATVVFSATVSSDGSFSGQEGTAGTMTGRITGSHISGEIVGSACRYAFAGERT